MSALHQAAEDYLMVRRALGSKLDHYGYLLRDFVAFLEAAGATTVTTELAVSWAGLPGEGAHPSYLAKRLCVVRGFARHLQAFDQKSEVPPVGLVPSRTCRAVPYLYSDEEIVALMEAARSLTPALRGATYETLIGLLRATGMRVGEAIRLDRNEVCFDEGVLVVWKSKFAKSRELALHESTLGALRAYATLRDELCPESGTPSFFVPRGGARLAYSTVQGTFAHLCQKIGLKARSERCRPRLHDLRHVFASSTLLGWYRAGLDVEAKLPLLSTYMGHRGPASTYWYLSALPELLALTAERREHVLGVQV
jgi:integrase